MEPKTGGIILAGGRASRMGGGDKPLLLLGGQTLLARCIGRVAPQVAQLALNANGDPARFAEFGLPVLADPVGDHWGPLAGILAGLEYFRDYRTMASFPGDTPFLPHDMVKRLRAAGEFAVIETQGRSQPICALWPTRLAGALRVALASGVRKVEEFAQAYQPARVDWPEEYFLNINRPEDLERAEQLLPTMN